MLGDQLADQVISWYSLPMASPMTRMQTSECTDDVSARTMARRRHGCTPSENLVTKVAVLAAGSIEWLNFEHAQHSFVLCVSSLPAEPLCSNLSMVLQILQAVAYCALGPGSS